MSHANEGEKEREREIFFFQNVCKIERLGKCRVRINEKHPRDLRDFSARLHAEEVSPVKGKGE